MFGNSLELQYHTLSMLIKVYARCENKVLYRHVCIVFLPNPPIAMLELPSCLSHEWLTLLKRCYWLVRQNFLFQNFRNQKHYLSRHDFCRNL